MNYEGSTLPPEVLSQVIDWVSVPNHPLQYGFDNEQAQAIFSLCLASSTTNAFATPHLYSSICLRSEAQLNMFATTMEKNTRLRSLAHSIMFYDFDDAMGYHQLNNLIKIIDLCAPHLRRIVLDRDLRSMYPVDDHHHQRPLLRCALEKCTELIEFVSVQCELFLHEVPIDEDETYSGPRYIVWPYWSQLRRLSLYNPVLDSEFMGHLMKLTHIEQLVAHHFDPGNPPGSILSCLLDASSPNLRRFMITTHGTRGWLDELWAALADRSLYDRLVNPRGRNLQIVNIASFKELKPSGPASEDEMWFSEVARTGMQWTISESDVFPRLWNSA